MKILKKERGVTLIALIITIIVLLILAGVAFASLTGNDGILKRASDAAEVSKNAEENQTEILKEYEDKIDEWENRGKNPTVIWDGNVPVPIGFEHKEGTKDEGYVIEDDEGNEFVWVPVDDMADFKRDNFGRNNTLEEVSTTNAFWDDKTTIEYQNMVASVETYGGFYIARYEASFGSGSAVSNYKPLSKPSISNSTSSMSYIQGALWNNITQLDAITVCSNMYKDSESVVSHLPWGIEWDTMLAWLRDTVFKHETNPNSPIAGSSMNWGNYNNSLFKYGASEIQKSGESAVLINTGEITIPKNRHMKNKMYDIAGNLWEWTQEKYSTGTESVNRGGHYNAYGNAAPAAYRYNVSGASRGDIGFRPMLYIK